jgi:ribosome-binding protein aMBF1 (putative translation factor)
MERLVDVIKEGEIIRIPEWQARSEDLFILRTVSFEQSAPQAVSPSSVQQKADPLAKKPSLLDSWKRGEGYYKKNNVISDLVSNFHWEISSKRRTKGLSRKQLAEKAGIVEEDLKMIEMGSLPRDDFVLISRIENALGISLRKNSVAPVNLSELQKRNELQKMQKTEKEKDQESPAKSILGDDIEIID